KEGTKYNSRSVLNALNPKIVYKSQSETLRQLLPVFNKMISEDGKFNNIQEFEKIIGMCLNKFITEFTYKYLMNPGNSMAATLVDLPSAIKIGKNSVIKGINDMGGTKAEQIGDVLTAVKNHENDEVEFELSEKGYEEAKEIIESMRPFIYDKFTGSLTVTARPEIINNPK